MTPRPHWQHRVRLLDLSVRYLGRPVGYRAAFYYANNSRLIIVLRLGLEALEPVNLGSDKSPSLDEITNWVVAWLPILFFPRPFILKRTNAVAVQVRQCVTPCSPSKVVVYVLRIVFRSPSLFLNLAVALDGDLNGASFPSGKNGRIRGGKEAPGVLSPGLIYAVAGVAAPVPIGLVYSKVA